MDSVNIRGTLSQLDNILQSVGVRKVSISGVTSTTTTLSYRYPASGTDSKIREDHAVVKSVLSNPSAQTGDWTVTCYDGYLTIAGSIIANATTDLYLYLSVEH